MSVDTLPPPQTAGADAAWLATIHRRCEESRRLAEAPGLQERLVATVRPVVRAGRSDLIDRAIMVVAGSPMALAFQRAVEAAAEHAECRRGGLEIVMQAFAAPLLITLTEQLPETQVDWILAAVAPLASRMSLPGFAVSPGKVSIDPRFYRYEELALVGPCQLHLALVSAAKAAAWVKAPPRLPFVHLRGGARLSATYLRFLAGTAVRFAAERPPRSIAWHGVADVLAAQLRAHLGTTAQVEAGCEETFFGALYDGLWRYQAVRLAAVAQVYARIHEQPAAVVEITARTSGHQVRLDLYGAARGQGDEAYMLYMRPGEAPSTTLSRIAIPLRAGGIHDVTLLQSGPDRCARQRAAIALAL